jgi:hypothetical protein
MLSRTAGWDGAGLVSGAPTKSILVSQALQRVKGNSSILVYRIRYRSSAISAGPKVGSFTAPYSPLPLLRRLSSLLGGCAARCPTAASFRGLGIFKSSFFYSYQVQISGSLGQRKRKTYFQILLNALPTPGPSSRLRVFFVALVEKSTPMSSQGALYCLWSRFFSSDVRFFSRTAFSFFFGFCRIAFSYLSAV